jgi:ArsR family transcriptional regulator, virulence genes transcriptional regulator
MPPAAIDPAVMASHAGDAARLLKTLGNDRRLMILCMLVDNELAVGEINQRVDLSQSALSQHLAVLRDEGLVQTRRQAQSVLYSLAPGPAREIIETLHRLFCGAGGVTGT